MRIVAPQSSKAITQRTSGGQLRHRRPSEHRGTRMASTNRLMARLREVAVLRQAEQGLAVVPLRVRRGAGPAELGLRFRQSPPEWFADWV